MKSWDLEFEKGRSRLGEEYGWVAYDLENCRG